MIRDVTEHPVYFESESGPLFGVVSTPVAPGSNVVICNGGWHAGASKANRLVVRLARRLADAGNAVVRFDWHGAGESPGHIDFFALGQPFGEQVTSASHVLSEANDLPTSLVGICFGARSALSAAPSIDQLEAVVLVSFPLPTARAKVARVSNISSRDALRQALRPSVVRGWLSPASRRVYVKFLKLRWRQLEKRLRMRGRPTQVAEDVRRAESEAIDLEDLTDQVGRLVARNVRLLMVFGSDDALYQRWATASEGAMAQVLRSGRQLIDTAVIDGDLTGFSSLESQDLLLDVICDWLEAKT